MAYAQWNKCNVCKPDERMSIIQSDTGILGKRKSEKEICISSSDERLKSLYNFVVILGNCAFRLIAND